ncbi:MAG: hypothetical protein Q9220_002257 [cf. Caloplaca sp. 1 TL-2023]
MTDSANAPPTSISSLIFPEASQPLSKILSSLKRNTLSISNRLASIHHDSLFVQQVADFYKLPLIANERCGSWYIPPEIKKGSAYFKSTDGHQGQWSFSTRRLNLQVLDVVEKYGGYGALISGVRTYWRALAEEEADASSPTKPLRPIFLTPSTPLLPSPPQPTPYHPILCLTASHRLSSPENTYIQGAADDSESWSHGLTPSLFWSHKSLLLSTPEGDLPDLITSLTSTPIPLNPTEETAATLIKPTRNIYIAPLSSPLSSMPQTGEWDAIIICAPTTDPFPPSRTGPRILHLPSAGSSDKKKPASRALRTHLPLLPPFISSLLHSHQDNTPPRILFTCPTGTDLAVGAALVVLCLFFDEDGMMITSGREGEGGAGGSSKKAEMEGGEKGETVVGKEGIDKEFIRRRLAWISTSMPAANPSRGTLKGVHVCLMGR